MSTIKNRKATEMEQKHIVRQMKGIIGASRIPDSVKASVVKQPILDLVRIVAAIKAERWGLPGWVKDHRGRIMYIEGEFDYTLEADAADALFEKEMMMYDSGDYSYPGAYKDPDYLKKAKAREAHEESAKKVAFEWEQKISAVMLAHGITEPHMIFLMPAEDRKKITDEQAVLRTQKREALDALDRGAPEKVAYQTPRSPVHRFASRVVKFSISDRVMVYYDTDGKRSVMALTALQPINDKDRLKMLSTNADAVGIGLGSNGPFASLRYQLLGDLSSFDKFKASSDEALGLASEILGYFASGGELKTREEASLVHGYPRALTSSTLFSKMMDYDGLDLKYVEASTIRIGFMIPNSSESLATTQEGRNRDFEAAYKELTAGVEKLAMRRANASAMLSIGASKVRKRLKEEMPDFDASKITSDTFEALLKTVKDHNLSEIARILNITNPSFDVRLVYQAVRDAFHELKPADLAKIPSVRAEWQKDIDRFDEIAKGGKAHLESMKDKTFISVIGKSEKDQPMFEESFASHSANAKRYILAESHRLEELEEKENAIRKARKEATKESCPKIPHLHDGIDPDTGQYDASKKIALMPHQALAQSILDKSPDTCIIDIDMGGGKLSLMFEDAMNMIATGRAKRPCIVMPTNTIAQQVRELRDKFGKNLNVITITSEIWRTIETRNNKRKSGKGGGHENPLRDPVKEYFQKKIVTAPPNTILLVSYDWLSRANRVIQLEGGEPESEGSATDETSPNPEDEGAVVETPIEVSSKKGHRKTSLYTDYWASRWLIDDCGVDMVSLDESHKIKNRNTGAARSVRGLSAAKIKRVGSGTIISNDTRDLYEQLAFLDPSRFPTYQQFCKEFEVRISGATLWTEDELKKLQKVAFEEYGMVQMRRTNWMHLLPERIEKRHTTTLSEAQQTIFEALWSSIMDYIKADPKLGPILDTISDIDPEEKGGKANDLNMMLLQLLIIADQFITCPTSSLGGKEIEEKIAEADSPKRAELLRTLLKVREMVTRLPENERVSPKVVKTAEILREHFRDERNRNAKGQPTKVLIITEHKEEAAHFTEWLPKQPNMPIDSSHILYYDASKKANIAEFKNNPEVLVLCATVDSVKEGLNLQMANRAIRCSLDWAPGPVEQAFGRVYRPGQEAPRVYVDFVMTEGTHEVAKFAKLLEKYGKSRRLNSKFSGYDMPGGEGKDLPPVVLTREIKYMLTKMDSIKEYVSEYDAAYEHDMAEAKRLEPLLGKEMVDVHGGELPGAGKIKGLYGALDKEDTEIDLEIKVITDRRKGTYYVVDDPITVSEIDASWVNKFKFVLVIDNGIQYYVRREPIKGGAEGLAKFVSAVKTYFLTRFGKVNVSVVNVQSTPQQDVRAQRAAEQPVAETLAPAVEDVEDTGVEPPSVPPTAEEEIETPPIPPAEVEAPPETTIPTADHGILGKDSWIPVSVLPGAKEGEWYALYAKMAYHPKQGRDIPAYQLLYQWGDKSNELRPFKTPSLTDAGLEGISSAEGVTLNSSTVLPGFLPDYESGEIGQGDGPNGVPSAIYDQLKDYIAEHDQDFAGSTDWGWEDPAEHGYGRPETGKRGRQQKKPTERPSDDLIDTAVKPTAEENDRVIEELRLIEYDGVPYVSIDSNEDDAEELRHMGLRWLNATIEGRIISRTNIQHAIELMKKKGIGFANEEFFNSEVHRAFASGKRPTDIRKRMMNQYQFFRKNRRKVRSGKVLLHYIYRPDEHYVSVNMLEHTSDIAKLRTIPIFKVKFSCYIMPCIDRGQLKSFIGDLKKKGYQIANWEQFKNDCNVIFHLTPAFDMSIKSRPTTDVNAPASGDLPGQPVGEDEALAQTFRDKLAQYTSDVEDIDNGWKMVLKNGIGIEVTTNPEPGGSEPEYDIDVGNYLSDDDKKMVSDSLGEDLSTYTVTFEQHEDSGMWLLKTSNYLFEDGVLDVIDSINALPEAEAAEAEEETVVEEPAAPPPPVVPTPPKVIPPGYPTGERFIHEVPTAPKPVPTPKPPLTPVTEVPQLGKHDLTELPVITDTTHPLYPIVEELKAIYKLMGQEVRSR